MLHGSIRGSWYREQSRCFCTRSRWCGPFPKRKVGTENIPGVQVVQLAELCCLQLFLVLSARVQYAVTRLHSNLVSQLMCRVPDILSCICCTVVVLRATVYKLNIAIRRQSNARKRGKNAHIQRGSETEPARPSRHTVPLGKGDNFSFVDVSFGIVYPRRTL